MASVRGIVVVLAGVVVIGGGIGGYYWATGREAKKQVGLGWGRLSKCLVGEPLRDGEKASARFHRIELGAGSAPKDAAERGTGVDKWPDRCAVDAKVLYGFLLEAGYARVGDKEKKADIKMQDWTFPFWVDEFTTPMVLPSIEHGRTALDTLFAEAAKAGVQAQPDTANATPSPPPIPPTVPLNVDLLPKEEPLVKTVDSIAFGQEASFDVALPMLLSKNAIDPPLACLFGEKEASCKKASASVPAGGAAKFTGGADGMTFPPLSVQGHLVRADTGPGGDTPHPGEPMGELTVDTAWIGADGVVTALVFDRDDPRSRKLVWQSPGKPPSKPKSLPDDSGYPALYGGWLIATAQRSSGRKLVVAAVGPDGIGPVQELGASGPVSRCRTSEALFLATSEYLAIFADGAWSKPVGTTVRGRLSCRGKEATLTAIDGDVIKQERCTAAGCTQESVRKNEVWRDGEVGQSLVADLDGKLLVAWYDRGVVPLMKIAPIKEIKAATPIILFDPYTHGGVVDDKPVDAPSRIFVGNRFALMVVAPPEGAFVMRILPDGTFAFVKPTGDR